MTELSVPSASSHGAQRSRAPGTDGGPTSRPEPERRRTRKPRSRRRRLAYLGLGTVAGLLAAILAAEAVLRATGATPAALAGVYDFYESDGVDSVQIRAGYSGSSTVEGRTVAIATNRLGMRGPEIGAKGQNEYRVLVLGDSVPFGHGVEGREAFPALLERALAESLDRPVVVGNAGVPGASHRDQLRALQRHIEAGFAPDAVVSCVYTGNDFDGDFFGPKIAIDGYWFGTQTARLLENSWRARLALHSRVAFKAEKLFADHLPFLAMDRSAADDTAAERARYARFTRPVYEGLFMDEREASPAIGEVLDSMQQTFLAMREVLDDVPLLATIVPSFAQTWPGVWPLALREQGMSPDEYERGLGSRRLVERCAQIGVTCLDLTKAMADHVAPTDLYLPTDLHLSVLGHAFVAERLTPRLIAAVGQ